MILCLVFPTICVSQLLTGKVISIKDGDTIEILVEGKPVKIRLFGIDCPEKKQDFGKVAMQYTSDQCFNQLVRVKSFGKDQFKRILGDVILPDDRNLNQELVRNGLAWRYKHSKNAYLLELQQEAARKQKGLWVQKNPVPPWEWRGEHKRQKK